MRVLRAAATAVVVLSLAAGARAAMHHAPAAPAPAPVVVLPSHARPAAESPAPADPGTELSAGLTAAALAPLGTDSPGTDSAHAGRPAGGTRLLDTSLDAQGSRLRVYATSAAPGAVEPALARTLTGQGFARVASVDPQTISFTRQHDHVVLRFARRDDRTIVSIVEFGFRAAGEDQ